MPETRIENADQWKHGGDCSKCRRRSYCNKACKAAGNRAVLDIAGKLLGTAYRVISQQPYNE